MKTSPIDNLHGADASILPDLSKDKFLKVLEEAGLDLKVVKERLRIPQKTPDITLLRRYDAVNEYAERLQGKLISQEPLLKSMSGLGIRLTMSHQEAVSRARIFSKGAGIDFVVEGSKQTDETTVDADATPLPDFSSEQIGAAVRKSGWDFLKIKEELGVSADVNLVEVFVRAKTLDLIKDKFLENLSSRSYRVCDTAIDLNTNAQELITLLYLSKSEIAKVDEYSDISALSLDEEIKSTVKLISDTFGGFPVSNTFPRHYSFEASKLLEDILKDKECKSKLPEFKSKLGIKSNRSYYEIFQHYGLLKQLKSKIIGKLKDSGGVATPVAVQLGITYPTLKTLMEALDISLETERAEERIRKEVKEELESLFKDNVLYLATRYPYDVRTIIWGTVGSKLKAKYDYDDEMIKKILDEQLMSLVDERASLICQGTKKVPTAKKTENDEEESLVLDFASENLSQKQIADISGRIDRKVKAQIKENGIQKIVNDQAFIFLKELEEHYIFKKFSHIEPQKLKVSDVLKEIEKAKREVEKKESPGVLTKVLDSIKRDIEEAGKIQESLWNSGIKESTNLYIYQLLAVYRILEHKRFLLADEMGAGKTLVSIATFLQSDEDEALILGPKVALNRWMDDIGEHTNTKLEVVLLSDMPLTKAVLDNDNITIIDKDQNGIKFTDSKSRCNYLLNRRPPENGTRRIMLMNDDIVGQLTKIREESNLPPVQVGFLALDEVHRFKNPDTAKTKAVFGDGSGDVGIEANYVVAVSGTPIENDASDIIPLEKYLAHGMSSASQKLFAGCSSRDLINMLARNSDLGALSMLHAYIAERMIRRGLNDLMSGLPEKILHTVKVNPIDGTMTIDCGEKIKLKGDYHQQAALYEMALREPEMFEKLIVRGRKIEDDAMQNEQEEYNGNSTQLTRLRQTATDPGLFIEGCQSIKIDAIEELVRLTLQAEGQFEKSGLIFNTLKTPAKRLTTQLEAAYGDGSIAHIDGDVSSVNRASMVENFQRKNKVTGKENETRVLNATIDTMGTSGNLTQADCIFFMDLPWTSSKIDQAIGRARRIDREGRNYEGRELHVFFVQYEAPTSIDYLMRMVTTKKAILFEMLIDKNLNPDIIKAFKECGRKSIMASIQEARKKPVQVNELEASLAERLNEIMKQITESGGSVEKNKHLWTEAAIIYKEFLEHKSSYYANMASLDILSSDDFPELKGRKLKTLDLCSATSTLQSSYQKMEPELKEREFELDIYDFDANPMMLALGIPRKDRQILGKLKDVGKLEENSFDIVNLSYAFRYAEDPAQLIKDIRKILKSGGKLQVIIPKDNTFPPEFIDTLTRDFGACIKLGPAKLHSRLDEESYDNAKEQYGKKTADEIKKRAHAEVTYLLIEFNKDKEIDERIAKLSNERLNKTLRIERRIPISTGQIEHMTRTLKHLDLPDDGKIEGEITFIDLDDYTRQRRDARLTGVIKKITDITGLANLHDIGKRNKTAPSTSTTGFEGFLRSNLISVRKLIQEMSPLGITEKDDIRKTFEQVRGSSETCRNWLSMDNKLVQEVELLLQ